MFLSPKRIEKPWGHELWIAQTDKYVGKIIHVNAGSQLSLQYHCIKDETMFCLEGSAFLVIIRNGALIESAFPIGTSIHITPGTIHRLKAGARPCIVLETSTPEVDDVVRLEDDYGR